MIVIAFHRKHVDLIKIIFCIDEVDSKLKSLLQKTTNVIGKDFENAR